MNFNSIEFVVLFVATIALYYSPLCKRRSFQILILLAASAIFYAWSTPSLLFLLGGSCIWNALCTERIIFWKFIKEDDKKAKSILIWAVCINLILLMFFKYAGFIAVQLFGDLITSGISQWLVEIPLPIGISFYTFQGISLLIDTYRKDLDDEQLTKLSGTGKNRYAATRDISFYIIFFPQLVAGPIVKAREFVSQIGYKQYCNIEWVTAVKLMILGYFLKIVVADNIAEQTIVLTQPWLQSLSSIDAIILLYGYSLQIFADFAGYSLIAIGLANMFGYKLPINFNFPYNSTSITEFWQRWHISLSSWLRDYLYIPLGGNRKGSKRTYINLFLVMFLGGLWHGAAWKFLIWGAMHGVFLALERLFNRNKKETSSIRSILGWIYTFHVVTLLWLTFLMPSMDQIILYFKVLSNGFHLHGPTIFVPVYFGSFVVVYHAIGWFKEHKNLVFNRFSGGALEGYLYSILLFLILTNSGPPQGFIYFQF